MTEQEKVVAHISDCVKIADCQTNHNWVFVRTEILRDAIAMLKKQEPMMVKIEVKRVLVDDSCDVCTYADEMFYDCPSCGKRLARNRPAKSIKYCSDCGKAVKWE